MNLFDYLSSFVGRSTTTSARRRRSVHSPSKEGTRSSRRDVRRRDARRPVATRAIRWLEPLEARSLMAADILVSPLGDDLSGQGTLEAPFATIRRALDAAQPGDTISLRNGLYEGGINIDIDNLTIRSYPGEWGVIHLPTNDPEQGTVVRYLSDVEGGRLENVEIVGGYWYGVKLDDWWDNPGADAVRRGASGITIVGCKIHDTGWDAVKIVPGADDITIENNEIFSPGRRLRQSADGIDNNNGDRMVARNNYLHDIPSIGILTTGGTRDSLIEGNLIVDTAGAGITVGYYSELEWMEQDTNPELFTSFNTIARNNIVVNSGEAGIGIYASYKPQVVHNTLVNPARDAQAPMLLGGVDIWVSDDNPNQRVTSVDPVISNNLITLDADNQTRLFDARHQSYVGLLTLDGNLYHAPGLLGARFIDRNANGDGTPEQTWSQWKASGRDAHGLLVDPLLNGQFHLSADSPARDSAVPLWTVTADFDGAARVDGLPDIGADEWSGGVARSVPPAAFGAPSVAFAARASHALEGESVLVEVRRDGLASDRVTVEYLTVAGSAQPGSDFVPISGTLVFEPGETVKTLSVPFVSDGEVEGNEHLLLTLRNAITDGTLPVRVGWQGTTSLTIDDADSSQPVHYRTFWVSNEGSDVTGDGSQATPWKSLQFAADSVGPGDYVIVEPGNYWGFQITTDGKPDAPITFHARPGVLIDTPNPENNLDGINLEGADHVVIEGFEVNGMPRAGIRSVLNSGAVIRGNKVDSNGYWGILTGWSEGLLIENNIASRSAVEHGIYVSNSSDDGIVRHNIVWGNHASGIQFNADGGLAGDGIHSRNVVEGNVVFGNGVGGGGAINLDGFQDGVVRNNLLYDNHATGIVLYVAYGAAGSSNNLVVNNTVAQAEDARWAVLIENDSGGNILRNNIFHNANPARGSISIDASSLVGFDSDYNLFVDRFTAGSWETVDLETWKSTTGQDAHSRVANADQIFVGPDQHDFRLLSTSPALDAGESTFAPPFDLYHRARPGGAGVDIGALEVAIVAPQVAFEAADFVAYEESGMALITVTRAGSTERPLTVGYSTSELTALDGIDYETGQGTLTFLPGERSKTIQVFLRDDTAIEPLETFSISLHTPTDPTDPTWLGELSTATVHVVSDDVWRPGRFQFQTRFMTVSETESFAVVTVERVDGANGAASVSYSTQPFTPPPPANYIRRHTWNPQPTDDDSPATPGEDVEFVGGTLHFADGEVFKTFTVPIWNDEWFEPGEAVKFVLSDPSDGAELGKTTEAFLSILSDDVKQAGEFQFQLTQVDAFEGQPFVSLVVERTRGANVAAAVRLHVSGGNGTPGSAAAWQPSDFGDVPPLLEFARGETHKTIQIPLVEDSSVEGDEYFQVTLFAPTNDAEVGDPFRTTVRLQDNDSAVEWDQAGSFAAAEDGGAIAVRVVRRGSSTGSASVAYRTTDGSALAGTDFVSSQGVVEFADGETTKTLFIPLIADALVEQNESFGLALSQPQGTTLGSSVWGMATIVNDDFAAQPGVLSLSSAAYSVVENEGQLQVTVIRVGGSDGTVSVKFSTSDGAAGYGWSQTAWGGGDFTSTQGTLIFGPGELSKTFVVPIKNDANVERDEVFTVRLSNAAGGALLGATSQAVVTILEDDSSVSFKAANGAGNFAAKENDGGVNVTVVRQGGTATPASVTVKTTEWGSAKSGSDFSPVNTVVQFAPGESMKTVWVPIVNDSLVESPESFGVSLSNPLGMTQGSWTWSVQIQDDDSSPQPGQLQFQYAAFASQENWGYATISVTRSGGSSGAVSVDYSTQASTASAGMDYQPVAGTLDFADGETTKTFQVPLIDDALSELDEELVLLLSNPKGGASLGSVDQAILKLVSNE